MSFNDTSGIRLIDMSLGLLPAEESYMISNDDYIQNLDKWKPGKNNILYVTGLSGSGKSTLAKEYAKNHNAIHIEIDIFEYGYDSSGINIIQKCKNKFPDYKKGLESEWKNDDGTEMDEDYIISLLDKAAKYAVDLCKQDSSKLYIFEGLQIFRRFDTDKLKNEPLIIKGTSMLQSEMRAIDREIANNKNRKQPKKEIDIVKGFLKRHLSMNKKDEKKLGKFKQALESNITKESNGELSTYYFISKNNLDKVLLKPRIPQNYLTKHGYEDSTTPRICVSKSISGCLYAMSSNCHNAEFYVHELDTSNAIKPTLSQVPDSEITKEYWILEPCKAKLIGKIKCGESTNGKKFKYGSNTAILYGWEYSWIYKLPIEVLESTLKSEITPDYKAKGKLSLSNFTAQKIDKITDEMKSSLSFFKHIDSKRDTTYVWYDNQEIVGVGSVRYNDDNYNWITAIQVNPKYKGYGLGKQILDFCVKKLKGDALSVAVDNKIALEMYKKYGFEISKESLEDVKAGRRKVYFMYLK